MNDSKIIFMPAGGVVVESVVGKRVRLSPAKKGEAAIITDDSSSMSLLPDQK